MMSPMDIVLGLIGLALTVMVFSYILGDNIFFRIALYTLVGVTSGYTAAVLIIKVIIPLLVTPLSQVGTTAFYLSLVPLILSLLLILMVWHRGITAGRVPLAFLLGVLAAVTLFGIARGTLAPQLLSIVNRFTPGLLLQGADAQWSGIIESLIMLLGVVAVMFVFHHQTQGKGIDQKRSDLVEGLSTVGQIFLGITLGALFVGLYTTALSALISRVTWVKDFLIQLF